MKTYALLIGLNQYKDSRITPLSGCVNDINRFETYLKKKLGVPPAQITKLTDKQVTKKGVVAAFEKHIGLVGADDTFIFYFAGHGIRQYANAVLKSDAMNDAMECMTCYDTLAEGQNVIADKEMRWLIHRLYDKSGGNPHILTIFDCCHSGDNTRAVGDSKNPTAERCVRDRGREYIMPQRSWKEFIFSKEIEEADFKDNEIGALFPQGAHVQLAACAANETAKEDTVVQHGFFSTFLLETLESTNGNISYYDLRSLMTRRLDMFEPEKRQTPQFYAYGNSLFQPFLGGAAESAVKASVSFSTDRNQWEMTMGSIYGITEGAKIFVTLPKDRNNETESAVVKKVFQDYSVLYFDIESYEKDKKEAEKRIRRTETYSAIVDKFQQKTIAVGYADKKTAADWGKFCKKSAGLLELASVKPSTTKPDYVLNTEGGNIFVAYPSAPAKPIVELVDFKDKNAGFTNVLKQLKAASRFEFVKSQNNGAASESIFDNLSISFDRASGNVDLLKNPQVVCKVEKYTTSKPNESYKMDESLSIKITNNGGSNIYIAGIWLSEFFGIDVNTINANSIAVPLQSTKSFYVYKPTFRLTFKNHVFADKWDKFSNFLKIYASTAPFEITQLQQADLDAPRMSSKRGETASRGAEGDDDTAPMPDWAAKTFELVLDTSKIV